MFRLKDNACVPDTNQQRIPAKVDDCLQLAIELRLRKVVTDVSGVSSRGGLRRERIHLNEDLPSKLPLKG